MSCAANNGFNVFIGDPPPWFPAKTYCLQIRSLQIRFPSHSFNEGCVNVAFYGHKGTATWTLDISETSELPGNTRGCRLAAVLPVRGDLQRGDGRFAVAAVPAAV
ncbi:hypothetical protein BV898_07029 [Hypsibius exemplaris]|uniref:Uncharacterized protein n=1 Tax=Hypsibius exemplaris TaxID=2072580 RepID=A0A1W0WUU8_HYPEX|nr:hypothetical protein BV898_07029 [Hypsibius exemplaris]